MEQELNDFFSGDLGTTPGKPQAGIPPQLSSKFPSTSHPMASKNNIVTALDYMRQNHAGAVVNPMGMGKEYFFSPQRDYHNFERYYNKNQFKNLGFRAARDNETLYNENSSWWDDMASASSQWGTLFGLGMKDAFGFGDLTDQGNAARFERAMNIGSSSKGGASGFTTNLFLNSGYSVGILAEVALEELAIAGASVLMGIPSGGTSLAAGGTVMAARAGRAGNKLYQGWKIGKNLLKTLDALKDANKARQYFQSALSSTGKFLNPLENTTDFLRSFDKIEDYRNLSNMAKTTMGFGAFYRDVRNIRLAWGESGLEGGMVRNQMEDELLQDFVDRNGRSPDAQEANAIRDTASKAGHTTAWLNLPTIYFSNKLVFDNMFKTFNPVRKLTQDVVERSSMGSVLFNRAAKDNAFEVVESGWKGFLKTAKNPRAYASTGLNYFKANLAEGIQESAQEVISGASTDYYTNLWKGTPLKGGYWAAVGDNIQKQFNGTGFETFISGFLMGGMIQPITKAPGYLKQTYSKFKDRAQYRAQKEEGVTQLNEMVNKLNDLYKDPLKYFNADLANTESQNQYAEASQEASEGGDAKAYHDLKDASFYDHVYTALRSGRMDTFKERMEDMRGLTPEEVKESFGLDHTVFLEKVDKAINRAQTIENRFNLVDQKYKNPFNPRAFSPGTLEYIQSSMNYLGWQAAQKEFVFNGHAFDRTLERMNKIAGELKTDTQLAKTSASDVNLLLSFEDTQREINTLKQEISAFDTNAAPAELKKEFRFKEKKLEYLKQFTEAMQEVMTAPARPELQGDAVQRSGSAIDLDAAGEKPEVKKAFKAYETYLKHIAKAKDDYVFKDNIETAFNKIVDYYQLNNDSRNLMDSVNIMLDPKAFIARAQRLSAIKDQLYAQKGQEIEAALRAYMDMVETNRLLQLLADINVFFDPAELDALLSEGRMPATFYYIQEKDGGTGIKREILRTDPKYTEAVNLIRDYMNDIKEKPIAESDPSAGAGYNLQSRYKINGDQRTYRQYAKQYGFDSEAPSTTKSLPEVLRTLIESPYATKREKAIARQMLQIARPDQLVTFSKENDTPGVFSRDRQTIVDARYSSLDYTGGTVPFEFVIIHEEIHRLTTEELAKPDSRFASEITTLREIASAHFTANKPGEEPFYGLKNNDEFVAEAMSNDTFKAFLAEVPFEGPIGPVFSGKSAWTEFVDSVVSLLKKLFGGVVDNTVLNAAIDSITGHIDRTFEKVDNETEVAEVTEEKLTPTTPFESLKQHPTLIARLVRTYKEENAKRQRDGVNAFDENWEMMSDEQIINSLPFKNAFVKMHSKARGIINDYNKETGRTGEPQKKTAKKKAPRPESVSDSDYNTFVDTGEVSPELINQIAQKVKARQQLSQREIEIFTNKTSLIEDRLQEIQAEVEAEPVTQWNRTLKQQISDLGYSDVERRQMTPAEAASLVAAGVTKEQRDIEEAAALRAQEQEISEHRQKVLDEVDALITRASNLEELDIAEQSIFEIFTDSSLRNLTGLTAEMIEEKIGAKKQELAFSFNFDDIVVGEVVIMNNAQETRATVTRKTNNTVFLEMYNDPSKTFRVKADKINERIKYKYSPLMQEIDMEQEELMNSEERELSNESQQNSQEVVVDRETVQRMITAAREDRETGWLDNVNECK